MRKVVFAGIALFFCASSTIAHAAKWEDVSGKELEQILSDKTATATKFVVYYAPDGTTKGEWGGNKYNGTWHINDVGHYCAKWSDWPHSSEEGCWSAKHKSAKKMKLKAESGRADKNHYITLKQGNTKDL